LVTRRYYTLDGLRGVGALFVVLHHFAADFSFATAVRGYLAVDLFFCLSGFVLTRGYAGKLANGMAFEQWMGVRLRRLYPLFFLSIVIGFAGAMFGLPGSELSPVGRLMALDFNLLMLPAPTAMRAMFPLNFVAWSLLIEMLLSVQFYWTSKLRDRDIWCLLLIGLAGLFTLRVVVGYVSGGYSWHDLPMGLVRGLFSFSAGMLIARKTDGRHIVSHLAWAPLAASALIFAANPPHGAAYDLAMIILGFPMIVLASVHLEPLSPRPFKLAGDLSYPCYALHWTTFFAVVTIFGLSPEHSASPLLGAAVLAAFLYACHWLNVHYDTPLRRQAIGPIRSRNPKAKPERAE